MTKPSHEVLYNTYFTYIAVSFTVTARNLCSSLPSRSVESMYVGTEGLQFCYEQLILLTMLNRQVEYIVPYFNSLCGRHACV